MLLHLNRRIAFDVLLTIAAVVGDCTCCEIDIVTDDSGAPGSCEKLGERALAGLVSSQSLDQRLPVKRRYIRGASQQRRAERHDRPFLGEI